MMSTKKRTQSDVSPCTIVTENDADEGGIFDRRLTTGGGGRETVGLRVLGRPRFEGRKRVLPRNKSHARAEMGRAVSVARYRGCQNTMIYLQSKTNLNH